MASIDKVLNYSKNPINEDAEYKVEGFDEKGFKERLPEYEKVTHKNNLTIFQASQKFNMQYNEFLNELHVYMAMNPGKVSIRYLSGYFRSAITKQKEIDAICWMKDHNPELSVDYICERLNIAESHATKIIQQHALDIKIPPNRKKELRITYTDIIEKEDVQQPIIKFYNQYPNSSLKDCIKHLKINATELALKNGLEYLIEKGYKIPCKIFCDPMLDEKEMALIVAHKEKNPYDTPLIIARKFDTTEQKVIAILEIAAEQYRVEKIRSYEFIFKNVLEEIDEIGNLCMDRFQASPSSSSRWLEIKQMGVEKKIKMLGLNAPAEYRIAQNISVESKEDKDAIIEAFLATNMIDVTNRDESFV